MKLLRVAKRHLNRYFVLRKHRNEVWMNEISNCQKEIATLDPHLYYLSRY